MLFLTDVSQGAETEAMAAALLGRYGRIDILCANAAAFPTAPGALFFLATNHALHHGPIVGH